MIGKKDHDLCLYVKHYAGRPPSLPIPKSLCPECIKAEIKAQERRKKFEEIEELRKLQRHAASYHYRQKPDAKKRKVAYKDTFSYAKDVLMVGEWQNGNREDIPKEVVELKLLMLQLKRAGGLIGSKTRTWSEERRKKFNERHYKQRHLGGKCISGSDK